MFAGPIGSRKANDVGQPSLSVIIRAYNEEQHLGRLLEGIARQSFRPLETILVDSGSIDATLAIAARYPVEVVSIRPEDFSFGRSLNCGCAAAQGDLLVFASAHIYPVYPDWLEQLTGPFHDETVALAYGKQRGGPTSRFSEQQIFSTWYPEHSAPRQTHPFCNNANAAVRRSLWAIHPYDEDLPGLEDLEWGTWALSRGFVLAYRAEAEVIHVHEESTPAILNRYRREAAALRRLRPSEHFRLDDLVRLYTSNVVSDMRQAARQHRLRQVAGDILRYRWMQFWATYLGFRVSGPLTNEMKRAFYYPPVAKPGVSDVQRGVSPIDYRAAGVRLPGDVQE